MKALLRFKMEYCIVLTARPISLTPSIENETSFDFEWGRKQLSNKRPRTKGRRIREIGWKRGHRIGAASMRRETKQGERPRWLGWLRLFTRMFYIDRSHASIFKEAESRESLQ